RWLGARPDDRGNGQSARRPARAPPHGGGRAPRSTLGRGIAMPVRVIGMIGVAPPRGEATVHVIRGGISAPYLRSFAQAADAAGFDLALVGYTASSAEGFLVAQHAAQHTERLGFLIAHRPGFVAPTLAARKIATFDHLTNGRIALHVISGA